MSIHFTPTNPCGHKVSETRSIWMVRGGGAATAPQAAADDSVAMVAAACGRYSAAITSGERGKSRRAKRAVAGRRRSMQWRPEAPAY